MSGRYVSLVFESDLPPALKFTAAVYASFADDLDGTQIFPSVGLVAYLRGIEERSVQYHVKELQQMEILEVFRPATQWLPTHYRMRLDKLPTRTPYKPADRQGSMLDPPPRDSGVQSTAPLPGVQPNVSGVQPNVSGVQPTAPDPSIDPSSDPSVHTCTAHAREEHGDNLPIIVAPSRDPDHAAHAWCSPRICVPKFLHKQFKQALGGQVTKRAARMRAFYAETVDAIPSARPIEPDPVKFWRAAFAARFSRSAPERRHVDVPGATSCLHDTKCQASGGKPAWEVCRDRTIAEARAERKQA